MDPHTPHTHTNMQVDHDNDGFIEASDFAAFTHFAGHHLHQLAHALRTTLRQTSERSYRSYAGRGRQGLYARDSRYRRARLARGRNYDGDYSDEDEEFFDANECSSRRTSEGDEHGVEGSEHGGASPGLVRSRSGSGEGLKKRINVQLW